MPVLRTDKAHGHYHALYMDEMGNGVTSTDKGHAHVVQGNVVLEEDKHSHAMEEIPADIKPKSKSKASVVSEVISLRKAAYANEQEAIKDGKEAEGFYCGDDQWDSVDREKLEKENRAALTLNLIEPNLDVLAGLRSRNRQDVKFFPVEGGDQMASQIMTEAVKSVLSQCGFELEENEVVDNQHITGRGIFNCYMSFERNVMGQLIVESYPWDGVLFGPHEKRDLSDLEYLVKTKFYSLATAKADWPDIADKITALVNQAELLADNTIQARGDAYATDTGEPEEYDDSVGVDPDEVNIAKKEVRVSELWRKEPTRVKILVKLGMDNSPTDEIISTIGWNKTDVNKAVALPGFRVIERKTIRMRKTTVVGSVLAEDEYPDLAEQDFHTIPVYAKKRRNKFWGKVKPVIDPQREVNKRWSQTADALNRMAGRGWFIYPGTFSTPAERAKFESQSSGSGWVAEVNSPAEKPELQEGAQFPNGLVQLSELANAQIDRIMNVTPEMRGMVTNATTAPAQQERKAASLAGNEFLHDNLALAKKKLMRIVAANIQKYYSAERLYRLLNSDQAERFPLEEIQIVLNNLDLTKLDITVGDSPYNETTRRANFETWLSLAQHVPNIPTEMLIDMSDAPDKEKYIEMVNAQREAEMQDKEATRATERYKAEIGVMSKMQGGNPILGGGGGPVG